MTCCDAVDILYSKTDLGEALVIDSFSGYSVTLVKLWKCCSLRFGWSMVMMVSG